MTADDPRERAAQRTLLMPRRELGGQLPVGFVLQEFVIERALAVGAYAIVYLARDTRLERRVAIKEYLPTTLAQRLPDGSVAPRLPRFAELFDKGLASFVAEARLLGGFDHPALLKVYRCWQAQGTAYMAMPYYEGSTLKQWLADLGTPPSERWLRALAGQLMQALGTMHAQRCLHRDVAPDNVLMLYDRRIAGADAAGSGSYLEQPPQPLLLDFGAARRVIEDATQRLTTILKSGYSPPEQYESAEGVRQGPWTDVYALCALLYAAATGKPPPASVGRLVRDELVPARVAAQGRYSDVFLAAIDAGLALQPEQRPQSMAALHALFEATLPAVPPKVVPLPGAQALQPEAEGPRRVDWLLPAIVALVLLVAVVATAGWLMM